MPLTTRDLYKKISRYGGILVVQQVKEE